MKYIVAVSGGVDSVVLLDMLARGKIIMSSTGGTDALAPPDSLIVAHFDHGIRPDSMDDATFVRQLAAEYELPLETKREELGPNASEELARNRRYAFLRSVAKKHDARVVTAHHSDDMVETIVINLLRGTGWRGLAVLDSPDIERPLLGMRKAEILQYARSHQLSWREDSTNTDTRYLRNDVRQRLAGIADETVELLRLYRDRQVAIKRLAAEEAAQIIGRPPYSRYFFIAVPDRVAIELLRTVFMNETGQSPTIPQRQRALQAVKTLHSGKRFEVTKGVNLQFTASTFIVDATL